MDGTDVVLFNNLERIKIICKCRLVYCSDIDVIISIE